MNKLCFLLYFLIFNFHCFAQFEGIDKKSEKHYKKCLKRALQTEEFNEFNDLLLDREEILKLKISENHQNLLLGKFNNSYLKERAVFKDELKIMKDESFVLNRIKIKEFRINMSSDLNSKIYCRVVTKDKKQFVVLFENVYKIENTFKFDGLIVFSRIISL